MSKKYKPYLKKTAQECDHILQFLCDVSMEEYLSNLEKRYATMRSIEMILHALGKIPQKYIEKHSPVALKEISRIKDIFATRSFEEDPLIWGNLRSDVLTLQRIAQKMLKETK